METWGQKLVRVEPESDTEEAAEIGCKLERIGDVFMSANEKHWIDRRRAYCRERDNER